MTSGRAEAAIRPAKPYPTGIRTPWRTSSSRPLAAVATSSRPDGSSSRIAEVSADINSRVREASSVSRSSTPSWANAASVTARSRRSRSSPSSVTTPVTVTATTPYHRVGTGGRLRGVPVTARSRRWGFARAGVAAQVRPHAAQLQYLLHDAMGPDHPVRHRPLVGGTAALEQQRDAGGVQELHGGQVDLHRAHPVGGDRVDDRVLHDRTGRQVKLASTRLPPPAGPSAPTQTLMVPRPTGPARPGVTRRFSGYERAVETEM